MMILFINICMGALLLITAMLWSEYHRDKKMAQYRKEIEALEQQDVLNGCPFSFEPWIYPHFGFMPNVATLASYFGQKYDYSDFCRNLLLNIV